MKNGKTGVARIIAAGGYSLRGLQATFREEPAFRQELLLCLLLLPVSFFLAADAVQWVLLMGSLLLMLIVELLNSAVENAIDRIGDEHHVLSGRAKDMGSAAVLLSLVLVALTWGAIAWQNCFIGR